MVLERHVTVARFCQVVIHGLVWFVTIGALQGANAPATPVGTSLDIHVQPGGFGKASPADITAVLRSAAGELSRHCPHTQLPGIEVYHRGDHPQTNFARLPGGRIGIGLATQGTHWAQYSFQFAHEVCHVLANYSNNHQPPRSEGRQANLWLEESLCETASLFTLRAMSRSWQTAPPYPSWKSYAVWFRSYVEQRRQQVEHHFVPRMSFSVWFRKNEPALRQNVVRRHRDLVIANQLLPIFESEPDGWETLPYLNIASANPDQSLAQHLAQWRSHCPKNLRPFVARVAALFALKL